MAVDLSVHADVKKLTRRLTDFVAKQVPFATALALNAVATEVQKAEQANMDRRLDRPTPFTLKSVAVRRATKATLTATVYVKPIAAKYLEPFEVGGKHVLPGSSRANLTPKDTSLLNQYGGMPRNTIKRLTNRKDVFVGTVTTATGEKIDGVWQRPAKLRATRAGKPAKRVSRGLTSNQSGRLKLLVRFTDPQAVTQRLDYGSTAQAIVKHHLPIEMNKALARAIATAK